MGRLYNDITETIGHTPLVRLNRVAKEAGCLAEVYLKLEFFNPLGSVKDRIGFSMIDDAEKAGKLTPGKSILVEPTSGNTGIALAFVAAAKGYEIILTMPDSMSVERRKLLKILGAKVILTPAAKGMKGAVARAEELVAQIPESYMPQQFNNPSNPEIHRKTTAIEIWDDTDGRVDAVVVGIGTGGTITGVGQVLKEKKPSVQMIAVEPEGSQVLAGKPAGPHRLQGIGAGFIPEVLDMSFVDEVIAATDEEAKEMNFKICKKEGIPIGISSGAIASVAIKVAKRQENEGKLIVAVIPSCAERYLSTWLYEDIDVESDTIPI
ncbi:cysteine synthase A [Candidatus Sumerlaeota bacterium]|nr:cysteine synthase A [Candidatus Sumerlaeota bacterium]